MFHLICTDVADLFAAKLQRKTPAYALVYRGFDHGQLRKVCSEIQSPSGGISAIIPAAEVRSKLVEFAAIVVELQSARNQADYDPTKFYSIAYARAAIQSARNAVSLYGDLGHQTHTVHRTAFLMLLLFERR